MGNKPVISKNMTEKEIMYFVSDECKKCKENSNDLIERIRILNINNVNLEKDKKNLQIESYNLKKNITKNKANYSLDFNNKKNQMGELNNKILVNNNEIKKLKNDLTERDMDIKNLNQKLLKNNCQRNYVLEESVKQINNDLVKCNKSNNFLEDKTNSSTKSSQNCNAVQLGLQNEIKILSNKLNDSNNTNNYKNSIISNSDRYISMWRTISLVFFVLFFIFLFLYIFKRGNCDDFEEKLNNLKSIKKI